MKTLFRVVFLLFTVSLLLAGIVAAVVEEEQNEVEERARGLERKDCYTWQEIEIVVFGEIQE